MVIIHHKKKEWSFEIYDLDSWKIFKNLKIIQSGRNLSDSPFQIHLDLIPHLAQKSGNTKLAVGGEETLANKIILGLISSSQLVKY